MAIRNKLWYSERIANELYPVRSRDEKIDVREIILVMDSVCNALAKEGLLETWKLGGMSSVEDMFCTTWEWLSTTDAAGGSYVTIPANYATLPYNQGIPRVYFRNSANGKKRYYDPVIIMQARDVENYRNTMGSDMEGRIGCYPKNGILTFTKPNINAVYGEIGLQLMVRSSADLADDAPYPIPADFEIEFIARCIEWFRNRKQQPHEKLKDNNEDK